MVTRKNGLITSNCGVEAGEGEALPTVIVAGVPEKEKLLPLIVIFWELPELPTPVKGEPGATNAVKVCEPPIDPDGV